MTTQAERESVIANWISSILEDGGVERYDDLHIDRIDSRWAMRQDWVHCGLEAFRIALGLRDRSRLDIIVALSFSLESGEKRRGADFATLGEFEAQLDWSPPSLYLFRQDREPWTEISKVAVPLSFSALFEVGPEGRNCYYFEFKQPDSFEYSRSVFLVG